MSGLCEFPGAETIATALGGRKAGGAWMARCPAHDDRKPSLSIRDGEKGSEHRSNSAVNGASCLSLPAPSIWEFENENLPRFYPRQSS